MRGPERAGALVGAPLLILSLGLSGCGGAGDAADTASASPSADPTPTSDAPSPTASETKPKPTPTPSPSESEDDATEIEIRYQGGTITPNGDRVEVALDAPVRLVITADVAGELHIHSTPEQEVSFGAGKTEAEIEFEQPGVVEVESHDLGSVVVQLQVS